MFSRTVFAAVGWRTCLGLLAFAFAARVVAADPDFTLTGIDGKQHKLSDYRGKWVVVNYWATWCPPCLEEVPELVFFHDKHKDKDAVVLGVNMEDISAGRLRKFVDENLVSYPVLRNRQDVDPVGPIPGLPTTYLIAPDGRIAARKIGAVTSEAIEAFMAKPVPK